MKNKVMKKTFLLLVVIFIVVGIMQTPVSAIGNLSIVAGKTNMTVGETTTLTVKGTSCTGTVALSTSDSSVISIEGENSIWIENNSSSVTLRANKPGTATITASPTSLADSDTAEKITSSKSITITVKEKEQAPDTSQAKLKSITVAGKTYNNPGTDFTVTVDAKMETTNVSAVAVNSGAKISGTGKKELKTGTNTVTITVTAPNGAKQNYNIRIRKLADTSQSQPNVQNTTPEPTPEETPDVPEILRLKTLMVDDVTLTPDFDEETFEYFVNVTNEEKLDIIAIANDENAEIEILGNENLIEGENEITITLTRGEGEQQEKTIYTIKATKEVVALETGEEEGSDNKEEQEGGFLSTTGGKMAVGIGIGAIVIGGIGVIIWKNRYGGDGPSRTSRREAKRRASYDDFED